LGANTYLGRQQIKYRLEGFGRRPAAVVDRVHALDTTQYSVLSVAYVHRRVYTTNAGKYATDEDDASSATAKM